MLRLGTALNQCQKYLKTNIFFFKVVKTKTKKERLEKPKKGKVIVINNSKHRWYKVVKL